MKPSKRQREIEARRAADPIAQVVGRTDVDYSTDELPTAPRVVAPIESGDSEFSATLTKEAKYPASVLDDLLAANEINREQYERLKRETK